MARISNFSKVKATNYTISSSFLPLSLVLSLCIGSLNAAPSVDFDVRTSHKLVFSFQHGGNHQHEYSSRSNVDCDHLPEQVSNNWETLTVMLNRGKATEQRCALLFHHGNCVDPVIALDFSTPQTSLPREVKSFRYCHSSCDQCSGTHELTTTTMPTPSITVVNDYEQANK